MDEIDKILNALETSIRSQDCDYVTKEGISNFIKNTFNPIIKEKFNSLKSQLIEKDKRIEELENTIKTRFIGWCKTDKEAYREASKQANIIVNKTLENG